MPKRSMRLASQESFDRGSEGIHNTARGNSDRNMMMGDRFAQQQFLQRSIQNLKEPSSITPRANNNPEVPMFY